MSLYRILSALLCYPEQDLLDIAALRLVARQLGLRKIEASEKGGFFEFAPQNQVDPG